MPDGLNTYKSTLTPQEVDEAFRNIGKVQANIEKAAGYAQTAEQYGKIVEQNTPAEIFSNPQEERTKSFLSKVL